MSDVPNSLHREVHLEGPDEAPVTLVIYRDYTSQHSRAVFPLLQGYRELGQCWEGFWIHQNPRCFLPDSEIQAVGYCNLIKGDHISFVVTQDQKGRRAK